MKSGKMINQNSIAHTFKVDIQCSWHNIFQTSVVERIFDEKSTHRPVSALSTSQQWHVSYQSDIKWPVIFIAFILPEQVFLKFDETDQYKLKLCLFLL